MLTFTPSLTSTDLQYRLTPYRRYARYTRLGFKWQIEDYLMVLAVVCMPRVYLPH